MGSDNKNSRGKNEFPSQQNLPGRGDFASVFGNFPETSKAGTIPEILPVLGLSDIVVFPGMVSPLLAETSQGLQLVDDAVGGNRLLGLFLQRKPEVADPGPEDLWEYGCAARILKILKFPDNTVRILVEGLTRIRVKCYEATTPYLKGRIESLKDVKNSSPELTALIRVVQAEFQEITKLSPSMSAQVKIAALNTDDPGHLSDLIAVNSNLSLGERQGLLKTVNVSERLGMILPALRREREVLAIASKIETEAEERLKKRDRETLLREKLRIIQTELGEPATGFSGSAAMQDPPIIKESLEKFRKDHPDPSKTCFLLMKSGDTRVNKKIVSAVRNTLQKFGFEALRADDKKYHEDLFPNVQTYLHGCGFGIAILERIQADEFIPNVSLEIGYMLSQRKPVLLLKDASLRNLHNDLVGKLYRPFDIQCPNDTVPSHIKSWLEDKGLI